MKAKFFLTSFVACVSLASALEFGGMGNTSAGMGGAGVALKNSAWGLYYNPALLSASPKVKFGYSLGVGISEKNLAQLATVDIANMQDTATRLASSFSGGSGGGAGAVNGVVDAVDKALDTVLGSTGTTGQSTQDKLTSYLQSHKDGNYTDLIDKIKDEVQKSSSLDDLQKGLLGNILGSVDYDNLKFDNSTAGGVANALTNITISKGSDRGLDKSMADIALVQDSIKDSNLSLVSQNGLVFQLGSRPLNNTVGTLAVGLFASAYSSMSINANPDKMRLILEAGGNYYELKITDSGYTYGLSSKSDYDAHSLLAALQTTNPSDAHNLTITSFVLSEIPIGYARTFYFKNSNLNVGVSGKLMNGISVQNKIAISTNTDFAKELSNLTQSFNGSNASRAFGVDVGLVYEIDLPKFRNLTFGLVGKNLNSPTFKSTIEDVVIKPQVRAGLGYYTSSGFNIAFDVDLTQNDLLAISSLKQKSQMIGGGMGFLWRGMDLRVGAMKDLRQDTGLILTGGINLLGFLDITLQSSTKFTDIQNIPMPQYLNLRVGGSFSW
ncbi:MULTISPECIES: conjugal transfer protein TraF [unclassified Helicobacter]|uniref:conjugal transfer protein TraF n=1 Tax=unclassified Helicobacter TaxID=2593540 RepID=UPI0021635D9F|nr:MULTISPECIES: conjugal transfer protein TraF [unclassified Helicobacter]